MTISLGPSVLDTSLCIPDLRARKPDRVVQDLVARAHDAAAVVNPAPLLAALSLRERLGSTAIGRGIAVPNVRSVVVLEPRLVFGRSRRGLDWKAPDDERVQLVFLVLSPGDCTAACHHEFLARVIAFARLQRHQKRLLDAPHAAALREALAEVAP